MFVNQSRKCPLFNLIFWKEKWNYYLFSGQNSKPAKSKIQLLLEWMECSFTSIYTWGSVNLSVKTLFKKHFFLHFSKITDLKILTSSRTISLFVLFLSLVNSFTFQRTTKRRQRAFSAQSNWLLKAGKRRKKKGRGEDDWICSTTAEIHVLALSW